MSLAKDLLKRNFILNPEAKLQQYLPNSVCLVHNTENEVSH